MRHVRDVGRRALAKPDEHAVLALHEFHAEPGPASIAPRGTGDRREPLFGIDPADARESLRDDFLLEAHLPCIVEVLEHAAAAAAEVFARRNHPLRRGLEHAHKVGLLQLAAALAQRDLDDLAGQRVGDENAPPVEIRDTPSVVREVDDAERGACPSHPACRVDRQAARNRCRCACSARSSFASSNANSDWWRSASSSPRIS